MMSVASAHIAELSQEMLIPSTIIRLLDSIGEGIISADSTYFNNIIMYNIMHFFRSFIGEFGLVYKGEIVHPMNTETVAVKTLKGAMYLVLLTSLKVQYC